MTIDFYYTVMSGPCRAVLLAAEAIGVELNKKVLDLSKKEHLTPEFLKLNPQHTVPTINDNGFSLAESRAIIAYLQNQYGKDESLYPKDPKKRAVVDQRLNFDMGTLFTSAAECYFSSIFRGVEVDPEKKEKLENTLKIFDELLANSKFAAGDNFTIADISLVITLSTIDILDHDLSPYKNITRWYDAVKKTAPGYEEINEKSLQLVKQHINDLSKKK